MIAIGFTLPSTNSLKEDTVGVELRRMEIVA